MRTEALDHSRELGDAEATIQTNLLGPFRMTNALIDHLITQANATIINVSSRLGLVPLLSTPTYSATKSALHSYTVSMRKTLCARIEVIELIPPQFRPI